MKVQVVFLACFSLGNLARAQERSMAAIAPASDGTIERLLTLPSPRQNDWLYLDTVADKDTAIAKSYEDQWRYHEKTSRYYFSPESAPFQRTGAMPAQNGKGSAEGDARAQFAGGVLRARLESSIKGFTRMGLLEATARKHTHEITKKLDSLKDASIPISSESGSPEIHFGYDLLADFSKIELTAPKWSLGAYHSNLSQELSSTGRNPAGFTLRASLSISGEFESSILVVPGTSTIEGNVGKQLSPALRAAIFGARAPGNQRCGVNFSYSL
jgi:hypothetical protein